MSPLRIAIVGAGVAGASVALELAARGHSPTILDRPCPGERASDVPLALVQPANGRLPVLGPRQLAAWHHVVDRLDALPPGIATLTGALRPVRDGRAADVWRNRLRRVDSELVRWLDRSEATAFLPGLRGGLFGAAWMPTARVVHAAAATAAWVERSGAATVAQRVLGVRERGTEVVVATQDGDQAFDAVVLCGGPGVADLLPPEARQVFPLRGEVVLAQVEFAPAVATCGDLQLLPAGPGRVLVAGTHLREPASAGVGATGVAGLLAAARETFALGAMEAMGAWSGVRAASADGRPVVGPLSDRISVCAGFGSRGFLHAPLAAAWVAEGATLGDWSQVPPIWRPL